MIYSKCVAEKHLVVLSLNFYYQLSANGRKIDELKR